MKKIMYWMLVAILISGASVFTACTNDDNETVDTEVSVTPSQSRVGYSAWNTQVSYNMDYVKLGNSDLRVSRICLALDQLFFL